MQGVLQDFLADVVAALQEGVLAMAASAAAATSACDQVETGHSVELEALVDFQACRGPSESLPHRLEPLETA